MTVPTKQDIATLPRWSRVAFAALCARRALSAFTRHWPGADDKHMRQLEATVLFAENAATNERCDCLDAAEAAMRAELVATEVHTPNVVAKIGMAAARSAAHVAYAAARAARAAASATAADVAVRTVHAAIADDELNKSAFASAISTQAALAGNGMTGESFRQIASGVGP